MQNKVFKCLLIVLIVIGLVACSKEKKQRKQISQSVVAFIGEYGKVGFKLGDYESEQGTLSLSTNQVKITCPDGYVIPSNVSKAGFGDKLPQATCDRKAGCQVTTVLLINPKSFSVKKMSISADKLTYMQANNDIALGAVCVKKDQVKNWV